MPALNDYVQVTGEHGTDSSGNANPFGYFGGLHSLYTHMRYILVSQANGIDYWQNTFLRQQYDTVYGQPNGDYHDIRYNNNTGSVGWEDDKVASATQAFNPVTPTLNGTTVELKNAAGTLIGSFTNPYSTGNTQSQSTSVDPATGALSYSVTTGVITWTINSTSPTSGSNDVYSVQRVSTSTVVGPLSHTNGQASTATITSSDSLVGNWTLFHVKNPGNSQVVVNPLAQLQIGAANNNNNTATTKKVHSNFW